MYGVCSICNSDPEEDEWSVTRREPERRGPALAVVVDQTGLDFSRNALDMGSGSFQEGGMD